jgi:hypothetical protein
MVAQKFMPAVADKKMQEQQQPQQQQQQPPPQQQKDNKHNKECSEVTTPFASITVNKDHK